ncbi:MAG: hypothetical protein GY765_28230 [bacterium]|nr:hypothetical protein [bacterium]
MNNIKKVKKQPTTGGEPGNTDTGATNDSTRKRKSQAFENIVGQAELMANAMPAKLDVLAAKGGDEAFIASLKTLCSETRALNKEQERLKAANKICTDALKKKVEEMKTFVRDGRNYVKMAIPQKQWVEFGITATR